MDTIIKYLLARADNLTAWIGFIGFFLELLLHAGHESIVMLVLFALLIILPETNFREMFSKWTTEVRDIEKKQHDNK